VEYDALKYQIIDELCFISLDEGTTSIHVAVVIKEGRKRCSRCNLDLTGRDYRYVAKHLARCRHRINPYVYSDRPRGRPTNKEKRRLLAMEGEEEE